MLWWFYELTSSVRFLWIASGETILRSKRVYEFILPSISALAVLAIHCQVPSLFVDGFVRVIAGHTFQFMVFVVPFHLAALGAFATFQRPVLDEGLRGASAELRVWSNKDQQYEWVELTLRQYASLLFGYLCTLGIGFIGVFILANVVNITALPSRAQDVLNVASIVSLSFFVVHYALLSIYAITFLFDKVNGIGRA